MNIIDHLHHHVTPKVLERNPTLQISEQKQRDILSSLYSLLGMRLSDPLTVSRIESLNDETQLLPTIFQDEHGNIQTNALIAELSAEHDVDGRTISTLAKTATPLTVQELTTLSKDQGIASYLQDKVHDFVGILPAWATALLPAGLLLGMSKLAGKVGDLADDLVDKAGDLTDTVSDTVSELGDKASTLAGKVATGATSLATGIGDKVSDMASHAKEELVAGATHVNEQVSAITQEPQKSSFLKSLLPIIGLIIFALLAWLLLRGCQDTKTPVAAPVASTTTTAPASTITDIMPATLSLATDETGNAVYSCRSEAGSQSVFADIRTAISGVFGVADKCEMDIVSGHADTMASSEHLPALFALMKGVPNSTISINDKTIHFNATDDTAIQKLIEGAKGILPADFVVEAEPQLNTEETVTNSINTAKTALENLTDTADADDLVRALNLQIINFATASSDIPAENKTVLDLAAEKLAKLPNAHLKITGHTDNAGNYQSNKALSDRRAKAVHDYLVSKGVPDEQLETFGASSDEPVASNATEQGRFQNRRIEFTLIQANGDVTSVGNAQNSQAVADTANN